MPSLTGKKQPEIRLATPPAEHSRLKSPAFKIIALSITLFFAIKFPMCFAPRHWEELRDFDSFVRTAHGEKPYSDFYWQYGPITPVIYGTILKIFPQNLLTVRITSFAFWAVGITFLTLCLRMFFTSGATILLGIVFTSGAFGYPSHSHSHVLAPVGCLALLYFAWKYFEEQKAMDAWGAAAACLIVACVRPIPTGTAVLALWPLLLLLKCGPKHGWHSCVRALTPLLVLAILTVSFFYLRDGWAFTRAYAPRPASIYAPLPYPNFHHIFDILHPGARVSFVEFFKHFRASLDTVVFYFHFFIWPTILFTLFTREPRNPRLQVLSTFMIFSLAASVDLLHYGYPTPLSESRMLNRGQYFFSLTAVSLFIFLWPFVQKRNWGIAKFAAVGCLSLVLVWSYLPFLEAFYRWKLSQVDRRVASVMSVIPSHPSEKPLNDAIEFLNSHCDSRAPVFVAFYHPGLRHLLRCEELLEKDVHILEYSGETLINPGESVYAGARTESVSQIVAAEIAKHHPKLFLVRESEVSAYCRKENQVWEQFTDGKTLYAVCGPLKPA